MVVLTTSQTTTTGMLAVLSYTTLSMGDVTAAMERSNLLACHRNLRIIFNVRLSQGHQDGGALDFGSREISSNGLINVLLAGLRSSGRHGDGCGVVASPMCCVEGLEVGGDVFAASGFGTAQPRKNVRREGSTALSLIVIVRPHLNYLRSRVEWTTWFRDTTVVSGIVNAGTFGWLRFGAIGRLHRH